jgi:nonsense-mediated mRNA decay protein 3
VFCVECGREGELIGPLCLECYSKKNVAASLPEYIDLTLCTHCSSFLLAGQWIETGSVKEAIERVIEAALVVSDGLAKDGITVILTEKDERTYEAAVTVALTAHGHSFSRDVTTTVRLRRGACKECSKQKGSYYESILQLRGDDRSLAGDLELRMETRVRERFDTMRAKNREVFLTKVLRVRGGLDFYASTAQSARVVARELQEQYSADFKESSSLWGRQDGRDVYRVTYLVRLPHFEAGDVLTCGSKEYYVRSLSKGVIRCLLLPSGEERHIKMRDLETCRVACQASGVKRAIVLMEGDSELQVLDPDTMAPVDVIKPKDFRRDGEQIRLVKTNLGKYALSDSW